MSTCHTPKGTPVQRSPSDGEGGHVSGSESPQHPDAPSTPLGEAERKRLVSSILQSPVRPPPPDSTFSSHPPCQVPKDVIICAIQV